MTIATTTNAVGRFLAAVEGARVPDCDAWADDAVLDATVPNWRLTRRAPTPSEPSMNAGSPTRAASSSFVASRPPGARWSSTCSPGRSKTCLTPLTTSTSSR